MPKEVTHWLVALTAAEGLAGGITAEAMKRCPHALQLGAVFPDVLFYTAGSHALARYRRVAQIYHGADGEDTYILVRRIAAKLPDSPYPMPLRAFLAGVACHIQTDATFHPLVYYLTGNYDDHDLLRRSQAVQGHRCLECLMDAYFCGGAKGLQPFSLKDILKRLELPLACLLGIPAPGNDGESGPYPSLAFATGQALRNFRIFQGLFKRRLPARLLTCLAPVLPRTAREILALFYSPVLEAHLPRLAGALAYRNPVTGHSETVTLRELFDRAVGRSMALNRRIEEAVASGAPVLPEAGPSLSYDVAGDLANRARYFAEKPFFGGDGSRLDRG